MDELIFQEFLQRHIETVEEWKIMQKLSDLSEDFLKDLSDNQKQIYYKLESLHYELQAVVEKLLIRYILNLLFSDLYKNHWTKPSEIKSARFTSFIFLSSITVIFSFNLRLSRVLICSSKTTEFFGRW